MRTVNGPKKILSLLLLLLAATPAPALGAGKKRPAEAVPTSSASALAAAGKRVIAIAPVEQVRIELPDQQIRDFGADFQARMITRLTQSGRFVVADPVESEEGDRRRGRSFVMPDPYVWPGTYIPAATVRIHVDALSMRAGGRGNRAFYGFDERSRNPFNDGSAAVPNEFPMRTTLSAQPGWFGESFASRGDWITGSLAGLDLGDGFDLNLLFVWFSVKYAQYHSALRLRVEVDAPLAGRHDERAIAVEGKGYFYDIVGGYQAFSAGIRVAHREAMIQAFERAIDGSLGAIERSVEGLPLTAVVDNAGVDGKVFLGTGQGAQVPARTRYESLEDPRLVLEVETSVTSGAVARVIQGDMSRLRPRQIFRQAGYDRAPLLAGSATASGASRKIASLSQWTAPAAESSPNALPLAATETIQLPDTALARPDLRGYVHEISKWQAFLQSLAGTITLPYRTWRYFQYDRKYAQTADDGSASGLGARNDGPVIAVIDSGVDYNHPALHSALWLNPSPWTDPAGQTDRYGWDFVSGDARPADDHFHGTRVASAVLAARPDARIMALKAFNPWGITSSAALYGAFRYAVEHGAQVIVCAWGTPVRSVALERGIELAHAAGIPVVAGGSRLFQFPAAYTETYPNVIIAGEHATPRLLQEVRVAEPRQGLAWATAEELAGLIAGTAAAR